MSRGYTRGFSLLELFVALVIIMVLSGVAALSLYSSRNRTNDNAIKANLATVQTEAEVYAFLQTNKNLSYGNGNNSGRCNLNNSVYMVYGDTTIRSALIAISAIITPGSTDVLSVSGKLMCSSHASPPDYTIGAILSDGKFWCIDSTGFSGVLDTMPTGGVTSCNS